jgi:RNA polymerase sigma-70 factor (ECF subfamily)
MRQSVRDDEELLIARSQRGDLQAFNQLVLRYQQAVYSLVFRMLGNADNAADVTQDAFLAAFRGINTYRGGPSFRAWLLRIGTNQVYDYLRRVQRRPAESLEALTDDDDMPPADFLTALTDPDPTGNPEAHVLTQELQDVIQQALEALPLEQRVAVVLCDVQGLSYEEIAATTETTLGTVRSRIARGRARLRDYLYQHRELLPQSYRHKGDG